MSSVEVNGSVNGWQHKVVTKINGWLDAARARGANDPENFVGGEKSAPFKAGGLLWEVTLTVKRQIRDSVEAAEADISLGGVGRAGRPLDAYLVDRQARWAAHVTIQAEKQAIIDDPQSTWSEAAEANRIRVESLGHQQVLEFQIIDAQARLAMSDNDVIGD